MTGPGSYEPRPRLLRHPVDRGPERIVLWPRRAPILMMFALSALGVAAWATARTGTTTSMVVGVVFLLAGLYLLLTNRPVLVVDRRGVRAPLTRRDQLVTWDEIAAVRPGASALSRALDVFVWTDDDHRTVERRLHLNATLLPVRIRTLLDEIETYRPAEQPGADPRRNRADESDT